MGKTKKETYCHDEMDPIQQTGGPNFVTESWDLGLFGTQANVDPGLLGPGTSTWGPGPKDPGTWTNGLGDPDLGT